MQLNTSTIQPRKGHQTDKYQGAIHTATKLRHGNGIYSYDNTFFVYEGQYHMGRKQGPGILKLKDGTTISGLFEADQLVGPAEIKYPNGAVYRGNLNLGEKTGKGVYDSMFESYQGDWKDNKKHGNGTYKNKSTSETYEGEFAENKPHGKGKLSKWNYSYDGQFKQGLKDGEGKQVNDWQADEHIKGPGRYEYSGHYKLDKFEGNGTLKSRQSKYVYTGIFSKGLPTLYPNEFRLYLSTNTKNGEEHVEGQKNLLPITQAIEYELEGDSFNIYIETVYQGPEMLDQIQPTPQQIENMIKNWQNENKKNKNPPPMPDFNQPRMKKPEIVLINQESGRPINVRLLADGKEDHLKVDYRTEIIAKRKENDELRQQALKKAEEDGGKKGGKKDPKGEVELKVNLYKDKPTRKETLLKLETHEGRVKLHAFELPDDFPPGKYFFEITSPYKDFGEIKHLRKQINVKTKIAKKK